jgi:hypothetical protein
MSSRQTVLRSLHDLGLFAWFGAGLMGTVGLNGGAAKAKEPTERLYLASIGWAKFQPVLYGAVLLHAVGGLGLIAGNKGRLAVQPEARTNTAVKAALELVSGAVTVYATTQGARVLAHADEGAEGVTEPGASSSPELASAQRQLKMLQSVLPLLTGTLIVLGAQQGEQQRPAAGFLQRSLGALRGKR